MQLVPSGTDQKGSVRVQLVPVQVSIAQELARLTSLKSGLVECWAVWTGAGAGAAWARTARALMARAVKECMLMVFRRGLKSLDELVVLDDGARVVSGLVVGKL